MDRFIFGFNKEKVYRYIFGYRRAFTLAHSLVKWLKKECTQKVIGTVAKENGV